MCVYICFVVCVCVCTPTPWEGRGEKESFQIPLVWWFQVSLYNASSSYVHE